MAVAVLVWWRGKHHPATFIYVVGEGFPQRFCVRMWKDPEEKYEYFEPCDVDPVYITFHGLVPRYRW